MEQIDKILGNANQLNNMHQWGKSVSLLEQHAPKLLDEARYWQYLATAHYRLDNDPKAYKIAKKGLGIDPENVMMIYIVSMVLRTEKKYAKAEKHLQQALLHASENKLILCGLALTYAQQSKFEQARPLMEKALQIEPESSYVNRIQSSIAHYEKDWDLVDESSKKVLSLDANDEIGHRMSGLASYQRGDLKTAEAKFRTALREDPHNPALQRMTRLVAMKNDRWMTPIRPLGKRPMLKAWGIWSIFLCLCIANNWPVIALFSLLFTGGYSLYILIVTAFLRRKYKGK